MQSNAVDPSILSAALDKVTGQAFEDFVAEFAAATLGADFVPVGGSGDGGADGFVTDHLRIDGARTARFLQTSIEAKVQSKIRHTIKRLREVGREPEVLTYFSTRDIPNSEEVEYDLGVELGLLIRVRDRGYIKAQINANNRTRSAFENHLYVFARYLERIGATKLVASSAHVDHPDVYVFLRQEVDRRGGTAPLVDAVVDSLIVWALEGTDPDEGRLMGRAEVRERILGEFPAATPYVDARLDARLEAASSKHLPGGRLIRWHRKDDQFVLPYETRRMVAEDNAEDEVVRAEMLASLETRFAEVLGPGVEDQLAEQCAALTIRAVQIAFENEGLEFARFVTRDTAASGGTTYLVDAVAAAIEEAKVKPDSRFVLGDAIIEVLRRLFYASTEPERRYLERLSRTYSILFTLQAEPRLIQYFEEMGGSFYLYVGSDLLIRSLSERYLAEEDRITRNMLALAATSGATIVLAEPVLEEVVSHLRATDLEFKNHIAPSEDHITMDVARQASRILIRSYLYAKLGVGSGDGPPPKSWQSYINQFCDYSLLHKTEALAEVRQYLQAQFGLTFERRRDLEDVVDLRKVAELAEDLQQVKKSPELADNDALMCHVIYGRRRALNEDAGVSEFGYRTWWLTGGEYRILQHTEDLIRDNGGDRYIMRPEFLLNFISLSPTAAQARATFRNVFPTLLGIRIARRMGEDAFHGLMDKVEEAMELEEGRRLAKMGQLANALKSDQHRQYDVSFEGAVDRSVREWLNEQAGD